MHSPILSNNIENPAEIKEMRYRLLSETSGTKVNGKVMLPAHASSKNKVPGAVLCHGFGADQNVMENSALLLVKKGIATITFDLRGHGFSGGLLDGNYHDDVINAWKMLISVSEVDSSKIALVGHSLGALSSILAAKTIKPNAIVALSCPSEIKGTILNNFSHKAFPLAIWTIAFIWKLTVLFNGIKVKVNWDKFIKSLPQVKLSMALSELDKCDKLFVFSAGDRLTPYKNFAHIYDKAPMPKQKMLTRGSHATPIEAEILRFEWVGWLVKALNQPQL
jgi:predicted alpha/beta-fold hydrolase